MSIARMWARFSLKMILRSHIYIDMLDNNTTGSALMFFMYGFSSYNQVRMTLDNMTKTSFVMK